MDDDMAKARKEANDRATLETPSTPRETSRRESQRESTKDGMPEFVNTLSQLEDQLAVEKSKLSGDVAAANNMVEELAKQEETLSPKSQQPKGDIISITENEKGTEAVFSGSSVSDLEPFQRVEKPEAEKRLDYPMELSNQIEKPENSWWEIATCGLIPCFSSSNDSASTQPTVPTAEVAN